MIPNVARLRDRKTRCPNSCFMRPNAYTRTVQICFLACRSSVFVVNLSRPTNGNACSRLILRACVFALVGCAVLMTGASRLLAGCHYGDGRTFQQMKHSDNPREHARNFSFLGQWVYERGEIKYVPWQGNSPCHGPNCHADKPLPASTLTPVSSVTRLPSVILVILKSNSYLSDGRAGWLCHDDCTPLAGFVFEHEHPPRMVSSF